MIFVIQKCLMKIMKFLKDNPGEQSLKVPFIIYADLECLLKKINTCQNNHEKSYTEKKAEHIPSGYSLVTCCSFDKSKNERKYYRGEDENIIEEIPVAFHNGSTYDYHFIIRQLTKEFKVILNA